MRLTEVLGDDGVLTPGGICAVGRDIALELSELHSVGRVFGPFSLRDIEVDIGGNACLSAEVLARNVSAIAGGELAAAFSKQTAEHPMVGDWQRDADIACLAKVLLVLTRRDRPNSEIMELIAVIKRPFNRSVPAGSFAASLVQVVPPEVIIPHRKPIGWHFLDALPVAKIHPRNTAPQFATKQAAQPIIVATRIIALLACAVWGFAIGLRLIA